MPGPVLGEEGTLPPTAPGNTHTHTAGGPDGGRLPLSSQELLLAAQPGQLGEECAPSVRQPRGEPGDIWITFAAGGEQGGFPFQLL